jgi:predicted nuclease with TOPRIM domain
MNPSNVDLKNSLNTLKSKKKSLLNKKKKIIKEINAIKIQEKELRNELKINEGQNKLVVSLGFDKRWSTYNCIVKFKDVHFSFYLGKEKAIKNKLQQFHQKEISRRGQTFIKDEIKEIVRAVVPNHLKSGNSYKSVNFKKIIELYILSGEWNYWKEV